MDLGLDPVLLWDLTPKLLGKIADRHLARNGVAKQEQAQTEDDMLRLMDGMVLRTKAN